MRVALISLDQSWEDKEANKRKIREIFSSISGILVDLIILPEMTLTGFTMNSKDFAEEFANSDSLVFFKSLAIEYNRSIVFGIILDNIPLPTNNLVVISNQGEVLVNYAKIHPFSYLGEDKYFCKGDILKSFDFLSTHIGVSICYDLRFPEIFQSLSRNSDIIINIANWPKRRVDHWRTLLKARAIENQVFFIGVNRIGVDGNDLSYEKSTYVVSPNGEFLVPNAISDEIDIYDINTSEVRDIRASFPVKNDRRTTLYKNIL